MSEAGTPPTYRSGSESVPASGPAVGEQGDRERRWKHAAGLADVLIVSLILAEALNAPEPRAVATDGSSVFLTVGLKPQDCGAILAEAQQQISWVHQALAV
jgi:hypothetical protein